MKYAIAWVSITGQTGHGKPIFSWEEADKICKDANNEFPDTRHWPVDMEDK